MNNNNTQSNNKYTFTKEVKTDSTKEKVNKAVDILRKKEGVKNGSNKTN